MHDPTASGGPTDRTKPNASPPPGRYHVRPPPQGEVKDMGHDLCTTTRAYATPGEAGSRGRLLATCYNWEEFTNRFRPDNVPVGMAIFAARPRASRSLAARDFTPIRTV